ncbi:hypothetical protein EDC94DRAFT_601222 [Helicostylum pulchrum]|nr:hypothetical protein EDC94DRAFT_601222 [Helicostylum pulchrum]
MLIKTLIAAASALTFSTVTAQAAAGGTCNQYPTNATCSKYVDYNVFLPTNIDFATIEAQFKPLADLQSTLSDLSPSCFDAYSRYSCSLSYSKCESEGNNTLRITEACMSSCEAVHAYCSTVFKFTGKTDLLPDCATATTITKSPLQEEGSCNNVPTQLSDEELKDKILDLSYIPHGFVMSECPAPFLQDYLAATDPETSVDGSHCRFGCCIPCPAQNLFYKENWATRGFLATDILRFISSILSFVLVLSYLVLPDKRRHPSLLILNMSIAIFIFSMVVFFSIGDPKKLQCSYDGIKSSTMDNNTLCAAQGALLIFGSLSTVLWCSALILNLHIHTVWNSNFFTNRYILLNIVCWGIPVAIMSTALGLHAVKFEFANLCLVSMEYIFPMFFYPMAAIVCPSFIVHIGTFFYIAKIAVREGLESDMTQSLSTGTISERPPGVSRKHVMVAVKIQWRALLLAVVAIVAVLFYWLFYMTQMSRMTDLQTNPESILDWLQCMLVPGNSQNICADVISPHLPPFALIIVAEALVSSIGIMLFVTFGKRSLWREWNDLIYDMRFRLSGRGSAEKHGEQFFAL